MEPRPRGCRASATSPLVAWANVRVMVSRSPVPPVTLQGRKGTSCHKWVVQGVEQNFSKFQQKCCAEHQGMACLPRRSARGVLQGPGQLSCVKQRPGRVERRAVHIFMLSHRLHVVLNYQTRERRPSMPSMTSGLEAGNQEQGITQAAGWADGCSSC